MSWAAWQPTDDVLPIIPVLLPMGNRLFGMPFVLFKEYLYYLLSLDFARGEKDIAKIGPFMDRFLDMKRQKRDLSMEQNEQYLHLLYRAFEAMEIDVLRRKLLRFVGAVFSMYEHCTPSNSMVSLPMWACVDKTLRAPQWRTSPKLKSTWQAIRCRMKEPQIPPPASPDEDLAFQSTYMPGLIEEFFGVLDAITNEDGPPPAVYYRLFHLHHAQTQAPQPL